MGMKSLKLSEQDKKEEAMGESVLDRPSYPHGLSIHLDSDVWDKLEMGDAPEAGQEFMVLARAYVKDVHQDKGADDRKKISAGLQITDMDIRPVKEEKDTATELYGG